jgi:hypothetical protein
MSSVADGLLVDERAGSGVADATDIYVIESAISCMGLPYEAIRRNCISDKWMDLLSWAR